MDKRKFERHPAEFDMRIYTSVKSGTYSVKISDISRNGAFIKSKHMPELGEIITFELYDSSYKPIHFANAKVSRLIDDTSNDEKGFGIMFDDKIGQEMINQLNQGI